MYCSKCGARVADGGAYCSACGARIDGGMPLHGMGMGVPSGEAGALLYVAHHSVWGQKKFPSAIVLLVAAVFMVAAIPPEFELAPLVYLVGVICAIVGIISLIFCFLRASHAQILLYENRIVTKSGLFNVRETESIMSPIIGVSVTRPFWGRVFGYGHVFIDKIGKGWDVNTRYVKRPEEFKQALERMIAGTDYSRVHCGLGD